MRTSIRVSCLAISLFIGCGMGPEPNPSPTVTPSPIPTPIHSDSDMDADGFDSEFYGGTDCNDEDPDINPDADDMCDFIDNDCDGTMDEAAGGYSYFPDADGDGFGGDTVAGYVCGMGVPEGYVVIGGNDCDDTDPATNDEALEQCDGKDNNCDGVIPEDEMDADNDGYRVCANDCFDTIDWMNPGAPDLCDEYDLDENCNGTYDEGCP